MNSKEKLNERIFRWLRPDGCWHSFQPVMVDLKTTFVCLRCGSDNSGDTNPDYQSPTGFFLLLAGLKSKGCVVNMNTGTKDEPEYLVDIVGAGDNCSDAITECANTLPLALVAAVEKLIEEQP